MKKYIRNKHIIHYIQKGKYLCIGSVKPSLEKSTRILRKVNCKNCNYLLYYSLIPGKFIGSKIKKLK